MQAKSEQVGCGLQKPDSSRGESVVTVKVLNLCTVMLVLARALARASPRMHMQLLGRRAGAAPSH